MKYYHILPVPDPFIHCHPEGFRVQGFGKVIRQLKTFYSLEGPWAVLDSQRTNTEAHSSIDTINNLKD